ncbi:MAG TPA: carbohydrate ABC transporter permease [Candidatus Binatus sp.]|uniref:carbohydrate ABC transporter permease n=1 Tax=Candidatus Binatus sp. TaxID=2811406 RepID=UPI002F40EFA5
MNNPARGDRIGDLLQAARFALNAFVLIAATLPLYLLAKQSVTPELETFAWPPHWMPHHLTLAHFISVFAVNELRSAVLRSLGVATISAVIATLLGAMLAHAMARSSFAQGVGFSTVSGIRLLPMIAVAIPLGIILASVGIYDTPSGIGLAIVHAALAIPTAALTLYASFVAIPLEIEEAAWIDGASPLRIFLTIDLPLARASIATALILCFILSWDEFGFALLVQQTNRTLPPLLYYYTVFGNVGPASALALLMMIPAVCVVVALGPSLRGALTAGSSR